MMNRLRTGDRKGFTLIELIVVLVILGILAALAIPTFNAIRQRGVQTVAEADATTIARYASNIWGLYQGQDGDTEVTCAATCTVDEMIAQAASESGFTGSGPWEKGNTVLTEDSAGVDWELVAEAGTENESAACITYANQLFTVAEGVCA